MGTDRQRSDPMLRLRTRMSTTGGGARRVQGPVQPERPSPCAVGLRWWRAVRSDREKPFFHAYPGGLAYSFGMLGCDLHCAYCRNWVTSQALRDPEAVVDPSAISPEQLVEDAVRVDACVIVSTYNEPFITAEWAVAIFKEAKRVGLPTAFVSNGNATPRALDYLRPWIDLYKVDLKGFDDSRYRRLGGRLEPIVDTIRRLHALGV